MSDLTQQPADSVSPEDGDTDALAGLADKVDDKPAPDPELAPWIMEKVNRWRMSRDNNYSAQWENYYRIWRGKWDPSLKGKTAERSKLITPATQSAIDQTVSEMAEAVFGRGMWFDLSDPPPPAAGAAPAALPPTRPTPRPGCSSSPRLANNRGIRQG